MTTSAILLLLLLGAAACYWQHQTQADPTVTPCLYCGDLVLHLPGLPYRCPSCRHWWWID